MIKLIITLLILFGIYTNGISQNCNEVKVSDVDTSFIQYENPFVIDTDQTTNQKLLFTLATREYIKDFYAIYFDLIDANSTIANIIQNVPVDNKFKVYFLFDDKTNISLTNYNKDNNKGQTMFFVKKELLLKLLFTDLNAIGFIDKNGKMYTFIVNDNYKIEFKKIFLCLFNYIK